MSQPQLVVISPSGARQQVALTPIPFTIGRQGDNNLVLRDNRASRYHARISFKEGFYQIEDLQSRHGVSVNGARIAGPHRLNPGDEIDFGVEDSYRLVFNLDEAGVGKLLEHVSAPGAVSGRGGANLAKLRALTEVARALQSSLSTPDVLAAVVDAALTVTGAERGFLLLKGGDELEVAAARDRRGPLDRNDLRVPTRLIRRALDHRRELLSMNFDPNEENAIRPDVSVAALELTSVVCVPLVRVRTGGAGETQVVSLAQDTVGLLYMDSRFGAADLSAGNRELLQTLALEASTIIENARLAEEERGKRRLEEELALAREIQHDLMPPSLPETGWFRAAGSSIASHLVGGDSFDVRQVGPSCWSAMVADVSGKGVSAALLASLLQGAFLIASQSSSSIAENLSRLNVFLNERTEGEKYATVFCCQLQASGGLRWANAGHPAPVVVRHTGKLESLEPNAMPIGLVEFAPYETDESHLNAGDKIVIYSDGFSEAQNRAGEFFDRKRIYELLRIHAAVGARDLHGALINAVNEFTMGAVQSDDLTLLVLEYRPE